jgi:hypothetical protein
LDLLTPHHVFRPVWRGNHEKGLVSGVLGPFCFQVEGGKTRLDLSHHAQVVPHHAGFIGIAHFRGSKYYTGNVMIIRAYRAFIPNCPEIILSH